MQVEKKKISEKATSKIKNDDKFLFFYLTRHESIIWSHLVPAPSDLKCISYTYNQFKYSQHVCLFERCQIGNAAFFSFMNDCDRYTSQIGKQKGKSENLSRDRRKKNEWKILFLKRQLFRLLSRFTLRSFFFVFFF